ncbi:hypothetical protein BDK51DRAFT_53171 [Blyttiomyces helicus]|uniref:Uncharacterized protein n=1 Tax=Blyttiomyces helicus TaxID=388810 RepID=A0A4P9WNY1_9FUNG|nr:hypothetical protein BDK51DRAFT_53171 [Blyttiomyces helicus]|eukprot:RKO94202.1 hypothetical protein BDK51DRAFT_53171 [Blyttiomyces helicus]
MRGASCGCHSKSWKRFDVGLEETCTHYDEPPSEPLSPASGAPRRRFCANTSSAFEEQTSLLTPYRWPDSSPADTYMHKVHLGQQEQHQPVDEQQHQRHHQLLNQHVQQQPADVYLRVPKRPEQGQDGSGKHRVQVTVRQHGYHLIPVCIAGAQPRTSSTSRNSSIPAVQAVAPTGTHAADDDLNKKPCICYWHAPAQLPQPVVPESTGHARA